jgi:hypothetical protein
MIVKGAALQRQKEKAARDKLYAIPDTVEGSYIILTDLMHLT